MSKIIEYKHISFSIFKFAVWNLNRGKARHTASHPYRSVKDHMSPFFLQSSIKYWRLGKKLSFLKSVPSTTIFGL